MESKDTPSKSEHLDSDPYKTAGVDTTHGDELADWLASDGRQDFRHPKGLGQVFSGIGGFAGLFSIDFSKFKKPQLVASTDGVGTKLLLGLNEDRIESLGQDLVGMCVNDLYTVGATPLFFLDYYASGKLSDQQFKKVLTSIKESCAVCQMALLGGETAEMPGLYSPGHFDLAGFVVGVVEEESRLGSHRTREGDVLVTWQSTGFHSNGFSLIRKWLSDKPKLKTSELVSKLMMPTRLYHETIELLEIFSDDFHALSNITGGGISGNLPRVIGTNLQANIEFKKIPIPAWMRNFIEDAGSSVETVEPVFNLGAGMIAIIAKNKVNKFFTECQRLKLDPAIIGELVHQPGNQRVVFS